MRVASIFAAAVFSFASAASVAAFIGLIDEDTPPPQTIEELPTTLTGQMLIAAPDMNDPTFVNTRIYLLHHDERGAVGVVVNGPSLGVVYGVDLSWGGPVGQRQVFVLHDGKDGFDGALVEPGVVVAGHDAGLMRAMAHGRGPAHSRTFVGYAGWGPGQLERELAAGAWSVVDVDSAALFR